MSAFAFATFRHPCAVHSRIATARVQAVNCRKNMPSSTSLQNVCMPTETKTLLDIIATKGWTLREKGDAIEARIAAAALEAAARIYPYVRMTPLMPAAFATGESECVGFLKLESEQVTGSFKARGAVAKVTSLSPTEIEAGIVTSSTGNHGLAFAYACSVVPEAAASSSRLQVYVPSTAVDVKRQKLTAQGAEVVVYGDDCLESELAAAAEAKRTGKLYASPYNDAAVIAGQGTIALELLAQLPGDTCASDIVVFVPVGGGGLIAGIAGVLKAASKEITVIGCQPEASQIMKLSVEAAEIVEAESLDTLSDGTAGGVEAASQTLEPCIHCVDRWETASEQEIADAMIMMISKQSKMVEGAAAVAVACATRLAAEGRLRGKTAVVICCGGNVALEKLQHALQMHQGGVHGGNS